MLQGLRIVEFTQVLAGPFAGAIFSDLGAEIIKVERPDGGDSGRVTGKAFYNGDSLMFQELNRGKKSVTVDISKPEGAQLVRELASKADVLLENYKFGDLARYGLGYAQLREINPKLVYCSITGFGQTGPDREKPGYDFMIQGMGGIMSVTGEKGGGPQRVGIPIADIMTGMYASIAVCANLSMSTAVERSAPAPASAGRSQFFTSVMPTCGCARRALSAGVRVIPVSSMPISSSTRSRTSSS